MFTQVDDLQVHYEVNGDGPPLVLLHGGGSNSTHFEEMVPLLAKEFRVYTPDLRGFGATVRPSQPPLSHELWLSDLAGFLGKLGLERIALAGWSLGGRISLNYALQSPEMVDCLILIGAASPLRPPSDRSGFDTRLKLIESGAQPEEIVEKTFEFTKGAFSPYTLTHNPRAVEKLRQEHLHNDPTSYAEMVRANRDQPDISSQLARITCPTLVIQGEHDARCPVEMGEDLNKAIPLSFMKIIPNCGHFYGYEQPEMTSQIMINFLRAFTRS